MTDYAALIPVNVITGFLGSGKTTLLSRLLRAPEMRDTAVLVNEFGEVGLDHHLLQNVAESTLLMDNGCLCCAMRGDLQGALRELFSQRERGEVPRFERVAIETSGLADPVPIAYTILAEPVIQHHFRLGNVVTLVDAVNGARQLEQHPESVKQAAVADRIVVTKKDLATPSQVTQLEQALKRLNPSATILQSDVDADELLTQDLYNPESRQKEVQAWSRSSATEDHQHSHGVGSFSVTVDQPLDWTAFGIWMTMLLHRHGEKVLRVKGMLNVVGESTPVLINGVQHIVHPPSHLDAWPDADRRSHIVFIIQDISRDRIEASLSAFNALANPAFSRA